MSVAALLVALVAEDAVALRNAPRDDAPSQATLWRGDWLEVRGETAGFLRVWDHRRERPGYVRPTPVRVHRADAATAPELSAVVRFLRDGAGSESLGIAYAALALRAGADETELLAAIGTMADRLARRASARRANGRDATLAAHVQVAESYGIKFKAVDGAVIGGAARLCYDGEAWERVLAAPAAPTTRAAKAASPPQPIAGGAEPSQGSALIDRARAALFLAGDDCARAGAPPAPAEERAWNDRRLRALESVEAAALPPAVGGHVRLRRAEALAWRGFDQARRAEREAAARDEAAAVRELALTDRGVLAPEHVALYDEVAVRVGAARWAADKESSPNPLQQSWRGIRESSPNRESSVSVAVVPRLPGESCVRVLDRERLLVERCTYGVVWQSALRWAPSGTAATLPVQPLPAWTELWVLRRAADASAWAIDVLTPATTEPEVGYVEGAGFSPDGARLLVAREARVAGRVSRRFQVLTVATLAVEKQAASADALLAFKRWSAPAWRAGTLALR